MRLGNKTIHTTKPPIFFLPAMLPLRNIIHTQLKSHSAADKMSHVSNGGGDITLPGEKRTLEPSAPGTAPLSKKSTRAHSAVGPTDMDRSALSLGTAVPEKQVNLKPSEQVAGIRNGGATFGVAWKGSSHADKPEKEGLRDAVPPVVSRSPAAGVPFIQQSPPTGLVIYAFILRRRRSI